MPMPGIPELLIIGGVVVLLFGAKKLPALGGAIGESIKNFKKGVSDPQKSLEESSSSQENSSQES